MKLYVQIKSVGKRKPMLQKTIYELPSISSGSIKVADFIKAVVSQEVDHYTQRQNNQEILKLFTSEEIEAQINSGKVSFDTIYSDKKADKSKAIATALQCYQDGLVRIFQNENELTNGSDEIELQENDCFTFIRFTFLAGRLF